MKKISKTQLKQIAKNWTVSLLKYHSLKSGLGKEVDLALKAEFEALSESLKTQWKIEATPPNIRQLIDHVLSKKTEAEKQRKTKK